MGFPVGYTEAFLPKLFIYALSFIGFLRTLTLSLFRFLGLSLLLQPDIMATTTTTLTEHNPTRLPDTPPLSAVLIRELLPPVIRFSCYGEQSPESCAVCLFEFERGEEVRRLMNCKHIFHRSCLDRWMDLDQKTCPLCRAPFLNEDMQEEFNQRLMIAVASALGDHRSH
ncbi:Homeobox protein B-H1 [Ancistrocladus abbreviatus]